jgi:hypothetical protein
MIITPPSSIELLDWILEIEWVGILQHSARRLGLESSLGRGGVYFYKNCGFTRDDSRGLQLRFMDIDF